MLYMSYNSREILTELGPCFIKLGQAISIRPDLLPSPFLFQLQKLCDAGTDRNIPTNRSNIQRLKDLGGSVESWGIA